MKLEGVQRVHISTKWILRPDWNFKFHLCLASRHCVFWCRKLSINVGPLANGRRRRDVTATRRAAVSPVCVLQVLHFCTFLLNLHFDLEADYIIRKPTKRRFKQYLVRTEILSTFHTRFEYISRRTICHSAHSIQWTECADTHRQTDTQKWEQ